MIAFLFGFIAGMVTILVIAALAVLNEGSRRG
ncbi:hypothetical protein UFOVP433_16 [uncultured Caudovirales phage]|uniref:Uncharacterized protein n=1 Tax=uncultured Caudovirales phage TaxID=2100421 RepID=A0A6J5MAY8_9CAUD|nr:hypothetical protein UFOVP433_16 [uncultured Caudovirales phage]CAB4158582.1 hypothetical protein UFOVP702_19 [uncultured Caudovirales phage]